MPRRKMMDYMMYRDGRNPYGSRGGYVTSRRGRADRRMGRDGLMMEDMRKYNAGEYEYDLADMTRQNQEVRHDPYMPRDFETGMVNRGDYTRYNEPNRQYDMAYDYPDMRNLRRNSRGQYMSDRAYEGEDYGSFHEERGFRPVEAMGYFTGYYGVGDYARSGRRNYNYDMRYDYAGDYGENLTKEELAHWSKKLMGEMEDKDKQFFAKENIMRKAKEMGIKFDKFNEEEFYVATLMMYTDYCKTLGSANMDIYLRLAKDWLEDDDVSVKGGEKLAVYHDNIVEEDD